MPFLNGRGDVIAGGGGEQGSFNRTPYPFPTWGSGGWLTDDTILLQLRTPSPGVLATWVPATGQLPVILQPPRGANDLAAGGGNWLAWLAGLGLYGEVDGTPAAVPVAGIPGGGHAVSPDGSLAFIPDRQVGYGLTFVDMAGVSHAIPGILPVDVQVIGGGQVIWAGGAYGRAVPMPAVADAQGILLAILPSGETWLLYWSPSIGTVAQVDGAPDGYILSTANTEYNRDLRVVGGELLVAWSRTQGEAPGDVVTLPIDRSQPRVPLVSAVTIPTFTFTQGPVLTAVFKDPNGDTSTPMEILPNQAAQQTTRAVIPVVDSLAGVKGPIQGLYSEAVDPTQDLALAAAHHTRLFLAHDAGSLWTLPTGLRPFDVPCMECYLTVINGVKETPDQAYQRCLAVLNSILEQWEGPCVGLLPMFYCEGGAPPNETFTVAEVCAWLQYFSKLVNQSIRTYFLAPFEYLRANGITGHPELQQAYARLLTEQARVGVASLPPVPSPTTDGGLMQLFVTVDPTKIIAAKQVIPSKNYPGCSNFILEDGSVFSGLHGDTQGNIRPSGTDGPWEAGIQAGGVVTFWANGTPNAWGVVVTGTLPR